MARSVMALAKSRQFLLGPLPTCSIQNKVLVPGAMGEGIWLQPKRRRGLGVFDYDAYFWSTRNTRD